ncbi:MAG: DUF3108 domain-containing protein [Acidobacteria bacterium]|nr:DUF3108 domain-containing protein [Acidobacteriota bacterium]
MKKLALLLISGLSLPAAPAPESLHYSINWPSGLSLGEGYIKSTPSEKGLEIELQFEAALPGFRVLDKFLSSVTKDLCSMTFEKDTQHGKRKTRERITFDQGAGTAIRETIGGGKSKLTVPACAKDVLAFLFHLRRELGLGRVPPAQDIFYGAAYRVRVEYKGSQKVRIGDAMEDSDRIIARVKGPASEIEIEAFIGKDAARTPLIVKVPLGVSTFSVELIR